MSVQPTAMPRRIAFHPLACADFGSVRGVLRQDRRFRLSHIGPLVAGLATTRQRRPYIEKTRERVAAIPEDWHRTTPPVFVLGFWRSGTTLLHEMLAIDRGFVSPRLMDILFPADAPFLIGHKRKALGAIERLQFGSDGGPVKLTRMIDLVEVALNRPQEEELATCHLAAPSFFRASFFPNEADRHIEDALFAPEASPAHEAWRDAHDLFLKTLVSKYPDRRLLLKNPSNSTRARDLLARYPDARFVRIDRAPAEVIPSFLKMMDHSIAQFSLQGSRHEPFPRDKAERLHERVIATLDADWETIDPSRRSAMRYEELTADPVNAVGRIYRELGMERTQEAERRQKRFWENRARHWSPKKPDAA